FAMEEENRLLAEQIPCPFRPNGIKRSPAGVQRRTLDDRRADLARERHEIGNGAEMDVRRVVQEWERLSVTGIRPRRASCARTLQWPKFGTETIARRPIRRRCSSTTRGWRVACKVCDRIT